MISTGSKVAIAILSLGIVAGVSSYKGYEYGSGQVQAAWDAETARLNKLALEKEQENKRKEQEHREALTSLEEEIRKGKEEYEKAIADIESDYDRRMRASEDRSTTYRRWAEASASEQRNLADHAARLDQALTEGRSLVEELRGVVRQREREIKQLGTQLLLDRSLIGETK